MNNDKITIIYSHSYKKIRGGIQIWAENIYNLFKLKKYNISIFYLCELKFFDFISIIKKNIISNIFILMTWKMLISVIPALILSKLFNKKYFYIIVHGDDILSLSKIEMLLFKAVIKLHNVKIISNSKNTANIFFKKFNYQVDLICYPFISTNINQNIKNNKKNIFLTITRLVPRKNIINTLKALKKLRDSGYKFMYYIAGDGPDKNQIQNYIQSNLLDNCVKLLGNISDDKKNVLLQKSNIFLLPSIHDNINGSIEGYGIAYIEANLYGIPVISGNTGGATEAVINNSTGIQTDGSEAGIELAIKSLIKNPLNYHEIISHAHKHDYTKQDNFIKFILKDHIK